MGHIDRHRTIARVAALTLVIGAGVIPVFSEPAAATPAPTTALSTASSPGGVASDIVAGAASYLDNTSNLVIGPDGRPWFENSEGLYSIAEDETLVAHPLPGAGGTYNSSRSTIQRASDSSLWLIGPAGMVRVAPDGTVTQLSTFGLISIITWGLTTDDRAVLVAYDYQAHTTTTSWISPDGTVDTQLHPDWNNHLDSVFPGPGGSMWGISSDETGYFGIFPDGSRVTLAVPSDTKQVSFDPQSDGQLFATYTTGGVNVLSRVEATGALTPLVTGGLDIATYHGEVFWATSTPTGELLFHRLSDPSWSAQLPAGLTLVEGVCWQNSTSSLWVAAKPTDGYESVFQITAGRVVPRLENDYFSYESCQESPDGALWGFGYSTYLHVSPDGSDVTAGDSSAGIQAVATNDDSVWLRAFDPSTPPGTSAIGHLAFVNTDRIAGSDRFDTAAQIASKEYPSGAPVVYVSSGLDFPDALAAGPAAAKEGGPLLLTAPWALPAATANALSRMAPARVVIVGGTAAISTEVESQIRATVPKALLQRLAGGNRYATAQAIVASTFSSASTVYLATGNTFPDALSASAAAGAAGDPVVLVNGWSSSLDAATRALVSGLHPSSVTVVGGADVVSDGILADLNGIAPATRLAGADRFSTAAAVARAVFPQAPNAFLANGTTFPDALTGAVWAASLKAPLLTSRSACLSDATERALLLGHTDKVTILGGTSVLDYNAANLLRCEDVP